MGSGVSRFRWQGGRAVSRDVVMLLAFAVLVWVAAHLGDRPGDRSGPGGEGAGSGED